MFTTGKPRRGLDQQKTLWQYVEVSLDVPVRDRCDETRPLVGLVVPEHVPHLAGKRRADHLVALESLSAAPKCSGIRGDLLPTGDGVVDVALLGWTGVEFPFDPILHGLDESRKRQDRD